MEHGVTTTPEQHKRYNDSPKGQERRRRHEARRIRMRAGGIKFGLGKAPTAEAAQAIKGRIREEAPHAGTR
jgi:hypothetical protein